MNRDVFSSSLSPLDSYNRGYSQNVEKLATAPSVTKIGNAVIGTDSIEQIGAAAQADGFYAIAYQWSDETVIS